MKFRFSLVICVLLILLAPAALFAQKPPMEITPLAGYLIGGSNDFYQGSVKIDGSFSYGLMYSVILPGKMTSIDLSFIRGDSTLHFAANPSYPSYSDTSFKMATNYIMIGSNRDFLQGKVRLFLGGEIGAAWFDSKDSAVSDIWLMGLAIKGGMKIYLSERLGLRLQGRFLMPIDVANTGLFIGMGGAGLSFGGNVFVYQGDFHLGLIIRL